MTSHFSGVNDNDEEMKPSIVFNPVTHKADNVGSELKAERHLS